MPSKRILDAIALAATQDAPTPLPEEESKARFRHIERTVRDADPYSVIRWAQESGCGMAPWRVPALNRLYQHKLEDVAAMQERLVRLKEEREGMLEEETLLQRILA